MSWFPIGELTHLLDRRDAHYVETRRDHMGNRLHEANSCDRQLPVVGDNETLLRIFIPFVPVRMKFGCDVGQIKRYAMRFMGERRGFNKLWPTGKTFDQGHFAWIGQFIESDSLPIDVIDSAACEQLDRSGTELELWLEGMWRLGKLVKVHGGGRRFGYGPSPRWLEAD